MPNTTNLRSIRREMLRRNPDFGVSYNIASLTTTAAVVTLLATGGYTSGRFVDRWLLRSHAASAADLIRRCTAFTSSSGTLIHAGTNYSDTTATSEILDILEHEPRIVDEAIAVTLSRLKRRDRHMLPCIPGQTWYLLGDLTWIEEPADIMEIRWAPCPILSNNSSFEKWNSYDTSGILVPDNWVVAGVSATATRSTTQIFSGSYSVALLRSGADATLTQTIGTLNNGVDSLASDVVTISGMVWASVASRARLSISDGVTTTNTDYHTGGSTWEELSTEVTIGAAPTTLTIAAQVNTGDTTAYFDKVLANYGSVTDAVRRGSYPEYSIPLEHTDFDQGAGTLRIKLPQRGYGSQYVIYSKRAYPVLDTTRFMAGTAEADIIDAPMDLVAIGAVARVYETLAHKETQDRQIQYLALAQDWRGRFNRLAREHLGVKAQPGGFQLNRQRSLLPPARSY